MCVNATYSIRPYMNLEWRKAGGPNQKLNATGKFLFECVCWPNLPVEIKSNQLILLLTNTYTDTANRMNIFLRRWNSNMNERNIIIVICLNVNCFASLSYKWWANATQEATSTVPDIIIHEANRNDNQKLKLVKMRQGTRERASKRLCVQMCTKFHSTTT